MDDLLSTIRIQVGEGLSQIDPSTSPLGRKIISHAVEMIVDIGIEKFTFKKLGLQIGSPEASIYRYFQSKNQLLSYLVSWYYAWMEYRLAFETANIASPETRLEKAIRLITAGVEDSQTPEGLNLRKLHEIIISESTKAYLNKDVDMANQKGAFMHYKQLVARISQIIHEINPAYPYAEMLLTTIIEGSHLQAFFAEHLPRLTNANATPDFIPDFYTHLAFNAIKHHP